MRVVLWGCGHVGHNIYNIINRNLKEYSVVAFGDTYCDKINSNQKCDDTIFKLGKILGFDDIKKLYEDKKIDGIIICISDKNQYNIVQSHFEVMGIPIYNISSNISAFDITENTYKIFSNKVEVAVLFGVDIAVNPTPINGAYSYLIKDNKVLWESDRFFTHSKFNFSFPLIYPIKEYDLSLDKACSLLFLGADTVYGHFIFACLNKIYAMEKAKFNGKYLIYDSPFSRKWIQFLQKTLNIDEKRIIYIDSKYVCAINVKELHIPQNIVDAGKLNAEILYDFSRDILRYIKLQKLHNELTFPKFLYVKRSEHFSRNILSETEEIITEYNFETIVPETLPIEMQIEYFSHAKAIIAAHGSNVANMIFMGKNSHLIELFDSSFVDLFYIECANKTGVKFNMLVSQNEYNPTMQNEYFIHPTLLKNTIENILK